MILPNFNSSMVRLGGMPDAMIQPISVHFNSSMVRLGAFLQPSIYTPNIIFQFQHGAIGRIFILCLSPFSYLISIPAWCDWEHATLTPELLKREISIPAWCDWETTSASSGRWLSSISIPAWCDWEQLKILPNNSITGISIPAWCDWEENNVPLIFG